MIVHALALEYGQLVQEHLPSIASHAELTTSNVHVSMPSNVKPDLDAI